MLFVEDDVDDVFLIERALSRQAPEVPAEFAAGGREAIARLAAAATGAAAMPAAVVTDLNMPGVGGFDLLRHMRADAALRGLPVIVMSSSSNPQDVRTAYECGANAFVVKPVRLDDLSELLATLVRFWVHHNRVAGSV
jgi:CheY-like chemotaxis protein